ncbi:tyrosine-type recombinase/integrase [Noviherbaspirillum sedimenti]|uniref:Tyr recombinase domain-containing protein n=1 Tax=Noviherbaspirillum sedimenti TaxID=2320865 RepID=A0A3A3GK09_9BURK|nr:tyrosine-type recombinase/integrase [Noviherbaspirillum sedimenti]RJG02636.1 hypothetical protein D3878_14505 [Noviherbaspirillum sedimenti]
MATQSSIKIIAHEGGRKHLSPTIGAGERAARVASFQKQLIKGFVFHDDPEAKLIALAITTEALVNLSELKLFLSAVNNVYAIESKHYVSWIAEDRRVDRREICTFTRITIAQCNAGTNWHDALKRFSQKLRQMHYLPRLRSDPDEYLTEFSQDAEAYYFSILPNPLFCHVKRVASIAALPDSAWARYASHRPLASKKVSDELVSTESVESTVLDALYENALPASGSWFIPLLTAATGQVAQLSKHTGRQAVLQALIDLAPQCKVAGPIAALLLGWTWHMTTCGTPQTQSGNPKTVRAYVSSVSGVLYSELAASKTHPLDLEMTELQNIYAKIMTQGVSGTVTRAALHAFHTYLVQVHDFLPLVVPLSETEDPLPRANLFWEHEVSHLRNLLLHSHDNADKRLLQQIRVLFELGHALHFRIGEALHLRLSNICVIEGVIEVEVAPKRNDVGLKTKSSRRKIAVTCPIAAEHLLAWVARRTLEGAMPDEFLFGDPHRAGSLYRVGATRTSINKLLKIVTGDDSAKFHMLRHGISFQMLDVLCNHGPLGEINAIDILSSRLGHASSQTIFSWYFHLPERPLRTAIDRASRRVDLNSADVARWTNIKEATIRKKLQRKTYDKDTHEKDTLHWEILDAYGSTLDSTPVTTRFETTVPPDVFTLATARPLDFNVIENVLRDIADGRPVESVCLRNALPQTTVERIASSAIQVGGPIFLNRSILRALGTDSPVKILMEQFQLGRFPDMNRCSSRKFSQIRKFLLSRSAHQSVAPALVGWSHLWEQGYLCLDNISDFKAIAIFLHHCEISPSSLLVRVSTLDGFALTQRPHPLRAFDNPVFQATADVDQVMNNIFGVLPRIQIVDERSGRPKRYLIITSQSPDLAESASSAASSMAGFHALMLIAMVSQSITESDSSFQQDRE